MKQPFPCATCGMMVLRQPSGVVGRVFCSRACCNAAKIGVPSKRRPMIGPDHPRWRGGVYVHSTGYRYLWKPEHPNANPAGYVAEHRFVMSEHLGRPLGHKEHVHHKNGIKDDNRLENLELLSAAAHASHHFSAPGWSFRHSSCVECGKTDQRHHSHGRCTRCNGREHMRQKRAAGYIAPCRRKSRQ